MRVRSALVAVLSCVAVIWGCANTAALGSVLDSSFGRHGVVVEPYLGADEQNGPVTSLVRDASGRLIVVGYSDNEPTLHLWRYSSRGRLDRQYPRPLPSAFQRLQPEAALVRPSGAVVLAGDGLPTMEEQAKGVFTHFAVAELTAGGMANASFGSEGVSFVPGVGDLGQAHALATDGDTTLAGGLSLAGGRVRWVLARFDRLGRLDSSFGAGGLVQTDFPGANEPVGANPQTMIRALVVLPDHRIMAVGTAVEATTRRRVVAVARYSPDGHPDLSFGGGSGAETLSFAPGTPSEGRAAILQRGRLVVAGIAGSAPTADDLRARFALIRLREDGTSDSSFGSRGVALTDFGGSTGAESLVGLRGGALVAGGGVPGAMALARYTPSGTLDHRFGGTGRACTDFTGDSYGLAPATGLIDSSRGEVTAAGDVRSSDQSSLVLARYRARSLSMIECASATPRRNGHSAIIAGALARRAELSMGVIEEPHDRGKPPTRTHQPWVARKRRVRDPLELADPWQATAPQPVLRDNVQSA